MAVAALAPATPVRCARLRAVVSARCCATRCRALWPSGRRKGAPRFLPCGRCEVGAAIAARLEADGWHRPEDSQPAEVLEDAQRAARETWRRGFPAYAEPEDGTLGPLAVAALATPDDPGVGVDAG